MAIRNIREMGDEILNKACKPVKEMNEKNRELVQDMLAIMRVIPSRSVAMA